MTNQTRRFSEALVMYAAMKAVRTPDTLPEMVVREVPRSPGWIEWRLVECNHDFSEDFAALEREAGFAYPPSFKDWYTAYYTLDMDLGILRLPEHRPGRTTKELRDLVLGAWDRRPLQLGLAAFGSEALGDSGPLCLDMRHSKDPERWPVVYWDHEWQNTEQEIAPPIFCSFTKLLECCTAFMRCTAQQAHPELLSDCIDTMMRLDAEGAGGSGRDYWENCKASQ